MSRRDIMEVRSSMRDAHEYLEKRRDTSSGSMKKGPTQALLEAAEVGVGAAGIGWLAGRMGSTSIGQSGVPLGLVAGAAGHAAAMFGLLPDPWNAHLQNVSNGFIAGWLALWGAGQGGQARGRAGGGGGIIAGVEPHAALGAAIAGAPPTMGYSPPPQMQAGYARVGMSPLSEAELQAMSREMR